MRNLGWFVTIGMAWFGCLLASCGQDVGQKPIPGEFLVGRWQVIAAEFRGGVPDSGSISFLNRVVEYHRDGTAKRYTDLMNGRPDHWRFESGDSTLVEIPADSRRAEQHIQVRLHPEGTMEQWRENPDSHQKLVLRMKRVGPVLGNRLGWGAEPGRDAQGSPIVMMDAFERLPMDYTGIAIRFWQSFGNDTQSVSSIVNGVEEGPYRSYSENGKLEFRGVIRAGNWEGPCESYYPNGQLMHIFEYRGGRHWNVLAMQDSLGNHLDFGTLKDGNGILKVYTFYAGLVSEGPMKDGLRHGMWYHWNGREYTDSTEYRDGVNLKTGMQEGS